MSCHCPLSSAISGSEELVFVARVAASGCYVIIVSCLWQSFRHRSAFCDAWQQRHLVAACRRMIVTLRQRWFAVPDARTRKIQHVMRKMQEDRCGKFMYCVAGWSVCQILVGIYQVHVAGLWSDDVDVERLRDALPGLPLIRQMSLAVVAVMSPISSQVVNAALAHIAFVVSSIGMQWLHTDIFQHIMAVRSDTAGRIVFAAFLGRPGLVFVLNVLFSVCTMIRSLDADAFPGVYLDTTTFLAVICAVLSQQWMQSEAGAIVAAMTSTSSEVAVQDLFDIMCDAVVVLDEHLVLAFPSPRLDALLLRCAPLNAGDEGPFTSLFHGTDKDRVAQFLTRSDGAAQCLHANLRDIPGSRLGVRLFHKRFEDVLCQSRHVIGVLEESDIAHQAEPLQEAGGYHDTVPSRAACGKQFLARKT